MRRSSRPTRLVALLLLLFVAGPAAAQETSPAPGRVWTGAERTLLLEGLGRTRDALVAETSGLTPEQWRFRESPDRWSILEVVEHLQVQDDMYFREIYLISQQPEMPELRERVRGKEEQILAYATDPEKAKAGWLLEPQGRWATGEAAVRQFLRSRSHLEAFVRETEADLRLHFTFRDYGSYEGLWSLRDLHQLLLTTIAHTERHVNQIRAVKGHPDFPKGSAAAEPAASAE